MEFFIFVACVTWFVRQCYGERAKRWEARGRALVPVAIVIGEDIMAVGRMAKAPFQRRRDLRNADFDGELRKLLGDR